MPRRSLPPRTPGAEPGSGVPAGRHRLSASPGVAEGSARVPGLLEPMGTDSPGGERPWDNGPVVPPVRSRTGFRATALLGVFAVMLGGWFWWQAAAGAPDVVPLSEVSAAGLQPQDSGPHVDSSAPPDGVATEPAAITVHVAGAVVHPGVVQLPAGSRLHQALTAAGGPTGMADPDRLNLAAVLEDGQKILVPERGQPDGAGQVAGPGGGDAGNPGPGSAGAGSLGTGSTGTGTGTGGAGPGAASGGSRVNLNTAGVEELGTLPRVGPVLAQRIVDWRKQHGRFQTVEELDAVEGVGPKLLETLLPLVRV